MQNQSLQVSPSFVSIFALEKLYNALPIPIIVVDTNLHVHFSNNTASLIFNLEVPATKDNVFNQFDKGIAQSLRKKISCLAKSRKHSKGKIRIPSVDKVDKYFQAYLEFLEESQNLIVITFTDITKEETLKKRIDKIHKTMNALYPGKLDEGILFTRLNEAVMQSANTIVITNLEGNIVFANPKFEETTGYNLHEAFMQNPRICKSGDQPDSYYKELWETISSGKVWKGEFKNKNKSGKHYWESAIITPIKDLNGKVVEYLAIKEEITERKLMEEKLEKTLIDMEVSNWEYKVLNEDLQKEVEQRKRVESELKLQKELLVELNETLESQVDAEVKKNREKDELMLLQSRQAAMGEMIGNIAHQWRQPLNAIGLMVYDLTDAYRFGELTPEYVHQSELDIKAVLEHMSHTIDDFRNFFKPNKEKMGFSLEETVKTSVSFLDATLKNSGIKVITEVDKDIELYGNASEFAQVLLNIINNAKDALIENETTTPVIRISSKLNDMQNAQLKISDNGGGIKPEVLHKIFDPYFTTKEQGKGTGVGLYMSKTIIERNMGGKLQANNHRNGAEFIISVPVYTL